jgi:hypothetical protein
VASFEEQFLANLALIQAALGGAPVVNPDGPDSFQRSALLLLSAIALTANGAGTTAQWDGITGDLVDQDELTAALASKQDRPVDYLTDVVNRPDLSVFDNVDTFANLAAFPATGAGDKIYIAADTNTPYRWTGSGYASIATVNATLAAIALISTPGLLQRLNDGTWNSLSAIAGQHLEHDGSSWQPVPSLKLLPRKIFPVGSTYTLTAADNGCAIALSDQSDHILQVPDHAVTPLPLGFQCMVTQVAAGVPSVQGLGNARVNGSSAAIALAGQWHAATLWKYDTNTWVLAGGLA